MIDHQIFLYMYRVSLPRETSVAKSLDFNRLVRIAPRPNNAVVGVGTSISDGQEEQDEEQEHLSDSTLQQNLQHEQHHNSIPTTNNLQDASHHGGYVSHLYADKHPIADSRALAEKLSRGTLETLLVLGMICCAIIASMFSVIWFIRSYRSINSAHENTIRRITTEDDDSSSSISYDDNGSASGSSSISENNFRDTRSPSSSCDVDVDVELDFEFSEDINGPSPSANNKNKEVTLNISSQNFSYA
jgi:hypothetical protein